MNVFWHIFETFVTLFEAFVEMRFVLKFQNYNFSVNSARIKYSCFSVGYAALITILTYFVPHEGLLGIFHIIYLFIASFFLVESKISTKILAAVIDNLIVITTAACISGMLSVTFHKPLNEVFLEMSLVRFGGVIAVQLMNVFLFDIILKAIGKDNLKLGKKEWTMILTIFAISFTAIALIQTVAVKTNEYTAVLLAAEICCIAVAAVCFYMTVLLNKAQCESYRLMEITRQEEFRTQYAKNIKNQYNEISQVRHDMKQTYSVVMSLLAEKKADEAMEYLKKTEKHIFDFDAAIDVGSDFANAILNAKFSKAKRNGIFIICNADKNVTGIEQMDLCNLLGNMLDNAIEACEKCSSKKRSITVNMRMFNDNYLIEVENTAMESVLENNKQLSTTKSDKSKHGYGVKSIRSIAEKYGGTVNYSQNDDKFRCTVMLSLKN